LINFEKIKKSKHSICMKKIYLLTLVLALCLSGQSQILRSIVNSAKNQAVNSATNKATEKVDREVDKGVNKLFDDATKEDSIKKSKEKPDQNSTSQGGGDQPPASMSKFMKSMGLSGEVPPHKELYKFTAQIVSVTEGTDGSGKKTEPVESTISLDEKSSDAMFRSKIQGNSSSIVMDQTNSCMIMVNESEKSGIISKIDLSGQAGNTTTGEATKTEDDCKMTKTGKTKSISGFNCSEYKCETATEISIAWTTKDFSAKNNKIFGNNGGGAKYRVDGMDGMVIQYEFYSKSDKSSSIMTIKAIDMNKSSSISLAGYQFTAFNIGQKK
jgi:hypothetical protein